MMKIRTFISLVLLCTLVLGAMAVPPIPNEFYGNVSLEGEPAPAGTVIEARIDGIVHGSLVTTTLGSYGGSGPFDERLIVAGQESDVGATILFFLNDQQAGQTAIFSSFGESVRLDLSPVTGPVVADFTANVTSGTYPLTVRFTDCSAGSPTAWNWSFGDGTASSEQHPVHTYTDPGSYTVSLTVSTAVDSHSLTKSSYINVSVPAQPPAVFRLNQNLATGTVNDTLPAGTHFGSYNYFLEISNEGFEETVLQNPSFSIETPGVTEYGWSEYAELNGNTLAWQFPESFDLGTHQALNTYVETSQEGIMNFSPTVVRFVNRTAFSGPGVQHLNFTVTFSDLDFIDSWGRITYPDTEHVIASKVPYSISTDAPVRWEFGDDRDQFIFDQARISSGVPYHFSVDVRINASQPTTYKPQIAVWTVLETEYTNLSMRNTVFVPAPLLPENVQNASAGSETETIWVLARNNHHVGTLREVIETTIPLQANFSANTTSGPAPLTVRFADTSTGNPTNWLWNFGDGITSIEQHPVHTYIGPGSYTVTLAASNSAGNDSMEKSGFIEVIQPPEVNLTVIPSSPSIQIGETVDLALFLDRATDGISGYNITVSVVDPSVAEISGCSFPEWTVLHTNSSVGGSSIWMNGVDLSSAIEPGASNISLGTLTVRAERGRTAQIAVEITQMDDDSGNPISPAIQPAEISIQPPVIAVNGSSPTIRMGESTEIWLAMDMAPHGIANYNLSIVLSNPDAADITGISLQDVPIPFNHTPLPADSILIWGVDQDLSVQGGETGIILGKFTITGTAGGNVTMQVDLLAMNDDEGYPVDPDVVPFVIEVIPVIPVPGFDYPPSDTDDDGLYEDLNGNGRRDFSDVVTYYQNMAWIAANEPLAFFDFNANGRIDFNDVVLLYHLI